MAQHVERQPLERALIVKAQRQRVEVAADLLLNPLADQRGAGARGFGDRLPGQVLAQH